MILLLKMVLKMFLNLYPEETGGHADAAPTLIFDAFNIIMDYQIINPLGDINGDGILFNDDIASLSNSLLTQNVISDYQWWLEILTLMRIIQFLTCYYL